MLDLINNYWSIITCIIAVIIGGTLVKRKTEDLDERVKRLEDMNIQVQLEKICTDLEWIKQALKEGK